MFYDNGYGLIRILIVGVMAYASLIVFLRISGKRALSKWNAFDFVGTIAVGSILATVIVSKEVPLIEGALALGLVIAMQFAVTWSAVRFGPVRGLIKSRPTLLMFNGQFRPEAMKGQRVTESEIFAALRSAGLTSTDRAHAVVLETDGSFSVVKVSRAAGPASTLSDVEGYPGR